MIKSCAHCGRPFKTNYEPKIYCSVKCHDRAHRKRSREIRKLKGNDAVKHLPSEQAAVNAKLSANEMNQRLAKDIFNTATGNWYGDADTVNPEIVQLLGDIEIASSKILRLLEDERRSLQLKLKSLETRHD